MKITKTIFFVLLITFFLVGCTESVTPDEGKEVEEVIEDKELKNELWKSILFDSIASVGNSDSFETPKELEVAQLAKFAYVKTVREKGFSELEKDEESRYIIKNERVKEVADKYFRLEDVDFSNINDRSYLEEKNGFAYHFTPQEEIPNFDESNPWSIIFDKLTLYEDNLYTARLVSYFGSEREYVQTEWIYELKKDNSSWIVKSMEKSYPDHGLVKINGDVELIPEIENYPKQLGGEDNLKILTIADGKLIVKNDIRVEGEYTNILAVIDTETMSMIDYIDVGKNIYGFDIKGENVIVKLKSEIVVYDHNLNVVNNIDVPEAIHSLEDREATYDDNYNVLTWYGGYDINNDFDQICYTDEEGLKIYYIDDEQDYLIYETPYFSNDSMAPYGYFTDPKFVLDDDKILIGMVGYESVRDYLVHDLTGIHPTYELEVGKYSILLHDIDGEKLIGINKDEGVQIRLATFETKNLEAEWPLKGDHERQQKFILNNSDRFAFTLKNYETDETLIYVVDALENTIDGPLVTVEKGDVNIIGILDDGSIFCSYHYYLNESGCFILDAQNMS